MSVTEEKVNFLKDLQKNNKSKFEKELKKIDNELFNEYCSKKSYKNKCEPAYCADAHTNTCQYLHEMRKIWNETGIKNFP